VILGRIIIAGMGLVALVGASAAVAATNVNTYTAKLAFKPSRAGTVQRPVALGFTENVTAANENPSDRAAPLKDIKTTIYGIRSNGGSFPSCDGRQMTVNRSDSFCPHMALVASGPLSAQLGDPTLVGPSPPCKSFLHVWNGGRGKLWLFLTTDARHRCGSLHTGDTAAFPATIKRVGQDEVVNVRLPADVSTAVASIPGLYGSLVKGALTFRKLTTKVKGKTVGFNESFACQDGKRSYSVQFTAATSSGPETQTIRGSAKC
jgi:hypothetical protein